MFEKDYLINMNKGQIQDKVNHMKITKGQK